MDREIKRDGYLEHLIRRKHNGLTKIVSYSKVFLHYYR